MKKLFFFKSSSGYGTDHNKQLHKQKDDQFQRNLNSPKGFNKSQSEVSGAALRRSRSLSSAAFVVDGTSSNDATRSSQQHRLRNHSSR